MAAAAEVFGSGPGQDPALAQPSFPSGGGGGLSGDISSRHLAPRMLRLPTVKAALSETSPPVTSVLSLHCLSYPK